MVERDGFGESTCLRTGFPIIGPRAALLRRFINVSQMCWRSEEAQSRMPSLVDSVKGGREGMRGLSTEEKINVRHDINANCTWFKGREEGVLTRTYLYS